jgi:uncharacterized protein YbbC (DUF1343 family)
MKYPRFKFYGLILALSIRQINYNMRRIIGLGIFLWMILVSCAGQPADKIVLGAEQLDLLIPKLKDKKVALMVNQSSTLGKTHLVDTLLSLNINIIKIFSPEHGFRGNAPDGEIIKDTKDPKTGLPIISLYGASKKPSAEQLQDVDLVLFDIQDVGVRYFTYISSLHYLMEACGENNKTVLVLDRPNPHGGYIDGPVLKPKYGSFVGFGEVPIVHGMTIGELAKLIIGEGWLKEGVRCSLEVIPMKNYNHDKKYVLPIKPSPNLPTQNAVLWYPSLCLFEGTVISVGRGTQTPFEIIGNPELKNYPFSFTPVRIDSMSKFPPQENKTCYGLDLRKVQPEPKITLKYLIEFYNAYTQKDKFFIPYFDKLAGNDVLRQQIISGMSEEEIKLTWQEDLNAFKIIRSKYLIYE